MPRVLPPLPFRPRAAALGLMVLLLAGGLSACGTPHQRCVAAASAELRTIDRLIAETEANIARGYSLERVSETRARLLPCAHIDGPFLFCVYDDVVVTERPRAIDRTAEARKLDTLRARRAELLPATRAALAACPPPA